MPTLCTPETVDLVLTHDLTYSPCTDGFCARWVAHCARGEAAEYVGVRHYQPPPDVKGRHVAIMDFAYDRQTTLRMAQDAASIIILDHHESARAALSDLPYAVFDMERSGAKMAFDWFYPEFIIRRLSRVTLLGIAAVVDYVQDQDLARHRLTASREINAALSIVEFDFADWSAFARRLFGGSRESLVEVGEAALKVREVDYAPLLASAKITQIGDVALWAVNAPHSMGTELGNRLAKTAPHAAAVFQIDAIRGKVKVSLRSSTECPHSMAELATRYGGGGHRHAAGFECNLLGNGGKLIVEFMLPHGSADP